MRKNKLSLPSLQLQLTGYFLGLVTFALIFQYVLVSSTLSKALLEEADVMERQELVASKTMEILWMSLGVILPITLVVGILTTFRVAGPISHFTAYLTAYCRGERPERIELRRADKLHGLADLINQATREAADLVQDDPAEDQSLAA